MSNSVQDPNVTDNQAADTPVEAPVEKGKGKADDTMDEDDDDDESGEVSSADAQ